MCRNVKIVLNKIEKLFGSSIPHARPIGSHKMIHNNAKRKRIVALLEMQFYANMAAHEVDKYKNGNTARNKRKILA